MSVYRKALSRLPEAEQARVLAAAALLSRELNLTETEALSLLSRVGLILTGRQRVLWGSYDDNNRG